MERILEFDTGKVICIAYLTWIALVMIGAVLYDMITRWKDRRK